MGSRVAALIEKNPAFSLKKILEADVAIDFSLPAALFTNLQNATAHRKPLVIGTTGHTLEGKKAIETASLEIPILFSPNFSLGMAACLEAAALIAHRLNCTIDIIETHHAQKKDTPSGTALKLREAMNAPNASIHSIRAGDAIGEHTVIFSCEGEKIELRHTVSHRDAFAKGALLAARFLIGKPPGLYSFKEIFS